LVLAQKKASVKTLIKELWYNKNMPVVIPQYS